MANLTIRVHSLPGPVNYAAIIRLDLQKHATIACHAGRETDSSRRAPERVVVEPVEWHSHILNRLCGHVFIIVIFVGSNSGSSPSRDEDLGSMKDHQRGKFESEFVPLSDRNSSEPAHHVVFLGSMRGSTCFALVRIRNHDLVWESQRARLLGFSSTIRRRREAPVWFERAGRIVRGRQQAPDRERCCRRTRRR